MESEASIAPNLDRPPGLAQRGEERSEDIFEELVSIMAPTAEEEKKRQDIVKYIGGLIREVFCQMGDDVDLLDVVTYGSVPLKTYMEHGDIDITALVIWSGQWPFPPDKWISSLKRTLEEEEKQPTENHQVGEVNAIIAEVSIVKCKVDGIFVDISVNSIGGLATLAFLENVDRVIGQNILKKSLILVKSWCYYESHILGSHRTLLSSYALETIVLHAIYRILRGRDNGKYLSKQKTPPPPPYVQAPSTSSRHALVTPLKVFEEVIEIFLSLDWSTDALSIPGPVPLEEVIKDSGKVTSFFDNLENQKILSMTSQQEPDCGENAQQDGKDNKHKKRSLSSPKQTPTENTIFVRSEFDIAYLRKCMIEFGYSTITDRPFQKRSMNIIDPLAPFNNIALGVNLANSFRIKGAMNLCSRKMKEAKKEAGDDYGRYCRLCLERAFEKVCIIANKRRFDTRQRTHISLDGDSGKIIDSFRVGARVWNTVWQKQDALPPIAGFGNPRREKGGYNRENGAGATGVPLRNAPASSRSALATDSYFQGETHDLYSFELHEQSQKADGAMSEESYTALRGVTPSFLPADKCRENRTASSNEQEDRELVRRSISSNDDTPKPSTHHANRGSRLHGGNHHPVPRHRSTASHAQVNGTARATTAPVDTKHCDIDTKPGIPYQKHQQNSASGRSTPRHAHEKEAHKSQQEPGKAHHKSDNRKVHRSKSSGHRRGKELGINDKKEFPSLKGNGGNQ